MNILCLYFSGTGNTEYVVEKIVEKIKNSTIKCIIKNIENFKNEDLEKISNFDTILFAYPIYGSMAPIIFRNFVEKNKEHFRGKKAIVVITQYLFSGDGGAYLARKLKKNGMDVIAIEHFNMPNNLSDVNIFKVKNGVDNKNKIEKTNKKIEKFSINIINNNYKKIGDNIFSLFLGLLQRGLFSKAEPKLMKSIKIDNNLCIKCGLCIKKCPVNNLYEENDIMKHNNNCTFCYRCINLCPEKAISLIGNKKPKTQFKGIKSF